MTYSKLSELQRSQIEGITRRISQMSPGTSLRISGLDPQSSRRVRLLVYEWLHSQGLKPSFRLVTEPDGFTIRNLKIPPFSVQAQFPGLNPRLEGILQQALGSASPAETIDRLGQRNEITEEEAVSLKKRLSEILS